MSKAKLTIVPVWTSIDVDTYDGILLNADGTSKKSKHPRGSLAFFDGLLVGAFAYKFKAGSLITEGTWVDKRYRGRGIGFKLWKTVLEGLKPVKISTYVASHEGLTLTNKVREKYPGIKFKRLDNGSTLIDLRTKKRK